MTAAAWFNRSITKDEYDNLDERMKRRYGKVRQILEDNDIDVSEADADVIEYLEENQNIDMVIDQDEGADEEAL